MIPLSRLVVRRALLTAACFAPFVPVAVIAQSGPVIEDGQAQVVPAFEDASQWIHHELWVETEFDSDGDGKLDRVHVDVTRPAQTDSEGLRVPVIYETSPYYAGTGGLNFDYFWNIRQEVGGQPEMRTPMPGIRHRPEQPVISRSHVGTWVPRGFAVVHSQSPGTGQSQGCPTVGGSNETLAPKAVIDWLNGRARGFTSIDGTEEVEAHWSTGRVGMTGTSYNGGLPVAVSTTGVEGLEAIIPVAPPTSWYLYYRSNGLVRSPGGYPGEDVDVLFDFIHSGLPEVRDYCIATVRHGELNGNQDRVTGDYNDFWEGRDYLKAIDQVKAATLMSHGFNDWNVMPEQSFRFAQALKDRDVPVQYYYHQGGHGGPPPLELMNRWFTRYVMGVENGVEHDPKAWIVREGDDRLEPTPYPDFPNPESTGVPLYPAGDGNWTGTLSLTAGADGDAGGLVDNFSFDGASLAAAEWSSHRLLYATPELTDDVHLSGVTTVKIRVAADAPAANLSVWLVSLPWTDSETITDNVITRGWADPQNAGAEDITTPRAGQSLTPGEFVELEFDLMPDDQVIPAGARIGLMIFSSDRDFTLWPTPGTTLTIDLQGTSIELPVVGGSEALARAIGLIS
jgi:X-Pro dipeptidyl-peptidase